MRNTLNIVVLIHGMSTDPKPSSPFQQYDTFWTALTNARPELADPTRIASVIQVEWGQQLLPAEEPSGPTRDDHKLTLAEDFINSQVAYGKISKSPSPNNVIRSGFSAINPGLFGPREIATFLREGILIYGLTDVVNYCSQDGEDRVRRTVYKQVLTGIEAALAEFAVANPAVDPATVPVRLHLFAHSLGVTLAHDLLYGLFRPTLKDGDAAPYTPGFPAQSNEPDITALFNKWRARTQASLVTLGGFSCAASQIPLLVMRKQSMIDNLFAKKPLDAADIGIINDGIQWKIFYDVDDILGFATRNLYAPNDGIMDYEVHVGNDPMTAHMGYWTDPTVIHETAQLFADWSD